LSELTQKAIGEPPLLLAGSVFFAIKDAIYAARSARNGWALICRRKEVGLEGFFRLDSPATCERIRMACCDDITKHFADPV
jgi:xanthine dehydrogenase/oxidase